MKQIMHGDISFHPLKEMPKNLKKVDVKDEFVVARGEVTSHIHWIKGNFKLFQNDKGEYILDMQKGQIEHINELTGQKAEHNTLPITKGLYIIRHERSYSPFEEEINKVID